MYYLSSVSIVKNESRYIKDFYLFHKAAGIEFFTFYDRTTEGERTEDIFKGYDDVEVINYPEIPGNVHSAAWKEGIIRNKGRSKWVACIDIDECAVSVKTRDLKEMLEPYESYAALGLNWHTFGGNALLEEPNESSYTAYTKRSVAQEKINAHIQSIVQPDRCQPIVWADPHHAPVNPGEMTVNTNFQQIVGPFNNPIIQDVGFIAHYYTRSKAYWDKKCAKKRADVHNAIGGLPEQWEHHQQYMNATEDNRIADFWRSIKP